MKKLFIIAAALLCGVCASARGFVGGSFEVGSIGNGTYFSLLPEIGFNISSKSTVAFEVGYQNKAYTQDIGLFKLSPYYRYTVAKLGEKVDFFVDGVIPLAFGEKYSSFGITVRPGFAFNVSKKIALVTAIGGLGFSSVNFDGATKTYWDISVSGADIKFGIYYKF